MLKLKQFIRLSLNFVPCMTYKKEKFNLQCLKKYTFFMLIFINYQSVFRIL